MSPSTPPPIPPSTPPKMPAATAPSPHREGSGARCSIDAAAPIGEASAMTYAVSTTALGRSFGAVRAVDGVDLAIAEGDIYGFLGPNGAGKSTLVRMLITLLKPSDGQASVAGYDVLKQPQEVRLRIGAALQEAALDAKQTGLELLRLQGRLYGLSGREVERRIIELLPLIDIGDALSRLIGTYSGGMKRRLDLAASLIHNPSILFLDEPTAGLDPVSRTKVWDEVRRINQDLGVTIFLTTQYLEEADALAGRVGIINHGKIAAEGTPRELKRSIGSDVIVARVSDSAAAVRAVEAIAGVDGVEVHADELTISVSRGPALISSVAVALNEAGVGVHELTLRSPTLDDVFLHYTGARLQESESPAEQPEPERVR